MLSFIKPANFVRAKVITLEPIPSYGMGHQRSSPRGIEPTSPSRRVKPAKSDEQPTPIKTSGVSASPTPEPENAPTLEPDSPL
jgi:hypothetical protein